MDFEKFKLSDVNRADINMDPPDDVSENINEDAEEVKELFDNPIVYGIGEIQKSPGLQKEKESGQPIVQNEELKTEEFIKKIDANASSALDEEDYEAALQIYNDALPLCPKESDTAIVYSRIATCHRDINQFDEMFEAAEKAKELDENSYEAHLAYGEVLIEKYKNKEDSDKFIEEGINSLKKAYDLCLQKHKESSEIAKIVQAELRRGRRIKFLKHHATDSTSTAKNI